MAVLENNPSLLLLSFFDLTDSLLSLTLTKRKRLKFDFLRVTQVANVSHRIGTRRQNNNNGLLVAGVCENFFHVSGRRRNESFTKLWLLFDDLLDHGNNFIGTENRDDNGLVQKG
jgi:hypothetical protein